VGQPSIVTEVVSVIIEIDSEVDINPEEFQNLFDGVVSIETNVNDQGKVISVIVYVNDIQTANNIAATVNHCANASSQSSANASSQSSANASSQSSGEADQQG